MQRRRRAADHHRVLASFFPPVCAGCEVLLRPHGDPLCARCRLEAAPLSPTLTRESGIEAVWPYDGPWRRALHRLKYRRQLQWAGPLGRELARASAWEIPWDHVIPVPLHWRRSLWRGFNQVTVIVAAADIGQPVHAGLLRRVRAGRPQRSASAPQRAEAVAGAFAVPRRARGAIAGRRVLVVDDVLTTGATLREAIAAVRRAGAAEVGGLALLRAA